MPRAVITQAHADHARRGHGAYPVHADDAGVLCARRGDITLQPLSDGEALDLNGVHGAVEPLNLAHRAAGVALPVTRLLDELKDKAELRQALVVAPPAVHGSAWARRLGEFSDAFASGWMRLRGARRRQGVDRGFALSDQADWPGLQCAIAGTGAAGVIVTHGYGAVMVRWLQQQGLEACSFRTAFGDETTSDSAQPPSLGLGML